MKERQEERLHPPHIGGGLGGGGCFFASFFAPKKVRNIGLVSGSSPLMLIEHDEQRICAV